MRRSTVTPLPTSLSAQQCFTADTSRNKGVTREWVDVHADKDGRADRFGLCAEGEGPTYLAAYLRVVTATGQTFDRPAFQPTPRIMGVTDVNGDGISEVWLFQGGATAHYAELVTFKDDAPIFVSDPTASGYDGMDGHDFPWAVTSDLADAGTECVDLDYDGTLEIVEESQEWDRSGAGGTLTWSYKVYEFDGTHIHPLSEHSGKGDPPTTIGLHWQEGLICQHVKDLLGG